MAKNSKLGKVIDYHLDFDNEADYESNLGTRDKALQLAKDTIFDSDVQTIKVLEVRHVATVCRGIVIEEE